MSRVDYTPKPRNSFNMLLQADKDLQNKKRNNPRVLCKKCKELVDEDITCPFCGNNVGHTRED